MARTRPDSFRPPCEPCSRLGIQIPSRTTRGYEFLPVCEWHRDHSFLPADPPPFRNLEEYERYKMAIYSRQVTVTTTPTALCGAYVVAGHSVTVTNRGNAVVYVGGSDVSISSARLHPGQSLEVGPLGADEFLYAVVEAGTQSVDVFGVSG